MAERVTSASVDWRRSQRSELLGGKFTSPRVTRVEVHRHREATRCIEERAYWDRGDGPQRDRPLVRHQGLTYLDGAKEGNDLDAVMADPHHQPDTIPRPAIAH